MSPFQPAKETPRLCRGYNYSGYDTPRYSASSNKRSLVKLGCTEHGSASEGGVEGIQRKGELQSPSCEDDSRIIGNTLRLKYSDLPVFRIE
jgi:hypothetical protein